MASYLDRYLAGEHERVWEELITLGPSVREEPLYSDASAVAYELMGRVKRNLETLIPRLAGIGYEFGYGWAQPSREKPYDWRERKAYETIMDGLRHDTRLLGTAPDSEMKLVDQRARYVRLVELGAPKIVIDNEERLIAELEAKPRQVTLVDGLERLMPEPLSLSLRAWFEMVDGVNLVGMHPAWLRILAESGQVRDEWTTSHFDPEVGGHPFSQLEPLHVNSLEYVKRMYHGLAERRGQHNPSLKQKLLLIQAGTSTYAEMGFAFGFPVVSGPTADAVVKYEKGEPTDIPFVITEIPFVSYLRHSLRWGGFPGWERLPIRPESDIATLTADLIPF